MSSAGFITGLYVVFTPLLALVLFRTRVAGVVWLGVGLALVGLALLSGIDAGDSTRQHARPRRLGCIFAPDCLDGALRAALRRDRVYAGGDARWFAGFALVAVAAGQVEVPHG